MENSQKTNFGFQQVDMLEKTHMVNRVFSSVANKYDLMNDLMSFTIHRCWKNKLVNLLEPEKKLIDVACGSADISIKYQNKCKVPDIYSCDINFDMLQMARNKLINHNSFKGVKLICADAENLPFDDMYFDYYIIAFGIRNVTNPIKALAEAKRVLKPGGKFLCLEFARTSSNFIKRFYDFYSFKIIPQLGRFILDDQNSYQYLIESIRAFHDQKSFLALINQVGFKLANYEDLSSGICTIYTGYKI